VVALLDLAGGQRRRSLGRVRYSWEEKLEILPRVAPFLAIILGVLYALYGGVATPSETAAVGALLCVVWRW
jgi:C4-dicarboxylate transporter DctM subunit